MEKPWELFENLNELVYVSDMNTCEIQYMNKYTLKTFGYNDLSEVKGKKCYEVLQGLTAQCSVCTNSYLKENSFYEWEYHNSKLGKTYALKDTMFEYDGKKYRMEMAIDKNLQDEQRKLLDAMIYTEETINKALGCALQEQDSVRSINIFLKQLGIGTRSDRVYIFEEQESGYVKNTYEWCAENVTAEKYNLQKVPLGDVDVWYNSFANDRNIVISELETIKEREPVIYKYLKPQNINSLVVSPLISGSRIIGFYGVDNPSKDLLMHVSDMAWIAGHFIVSMLKKRDLVDKLKQLSYYDQLTGLQNRHALNELTATTNAAQKTGIIYCDVMGLKRVNDEQGHLAGDALLKRAAECLKKQFRVSDLYRLGGDEFLVVCLNIDREVFERRVENLRADMPDYNALMALGCLWREETNDVAQNITEADYLMYQEKQEYYKNRKHGC